jgi:hypothetical protein
LLVAENKDGGKPTENIFQIMDGIIHQINNTKKIFVTLIVLHLILVPAAFIVMFAIFGPPFSGGRMWWDHDNRGFAFPFVPIIPIVVVLVWLGVGIRQWYLLSKWTKKYAQYKAMQKKIDEKLDYDENNENKPQ